MLKTPPSGPHLAARVLCLSHPSVLLTLLLSPCRLPFPQPCETPAQDSHCPSPLASRSSKPFSRCGSQRCREWRDESRGANSYLGWRALPLYFVFHCFQICAFDFLSLKHTLVLTKMQNISFYIFQVSFDLSDIQKELLCLLLDEI